MASKVRELKPWEFRVHFKSNEIRDELILKSCKLPQRTKLWQTLLNRLDSDETVLAISYESFENLYR